MNIFLKLTLTLVAVLYLVAGATIIRGTTQEVAINTTPAGAEVNFSNGQSCTSPCNIEADRNTTLQVTITKPGCHTHTAALMPTLAGGGVILGGLIDYGTGIVYDLQPNPMHVSLIVINKYPC